MDHCIVLTDIAIALRVWEITDGIVKKVAIVRASLFLTIAFSSPLLFSSCDFCFVLVVMTVSWSFGGGMS